MVPLPERTFIVVGLSLSVGSQICCLPVAKGYDLEPPVLVGPFTLA